MAHRRSSRVSERNRVRVRRLVKEGKMAKSAVAALPGVDEWIDPPLLVVPTDIDLLASPVPARA